ncbi:MAG TPA: hypothetical protein VJZ71_02610 [Phycisphaerae bacterium]|nr:hypothetical protein [Phycisphaerae bacterium]
MSSQSDALPIRSGGSPVFVAVCTILLAFVIVATASPNAFVVLIKHGALALGILAAASGLGLCLVDSLSLGPIEARWRWMAAAALGLGALSLLVLGLGTAGLLHRALWIILLAAFLCLGTWRVWVRRAGPPFFSEGEPAKGLMWLWLAAGIFGGLMFLAATLPPGILWPHEANGYDVLEYHLAAPREYFEAGRIGYLPHNIYTNFPFNVEMLYLLAMVLHGDAVQAALTANLLHALLGVLAVAAIWLAAREMGRGPGIVAGVMAAICPFIAYLGALAYVECGLLFFSAMALAATIRSARDEGRTATRWIVVSGLCAGFACGCKYTAIPATLIPLGIAALWTSSFRPRRAPWHAAAFLVSSLTVLSPWLIKNIACTGNPVFPLARSVFPERAGIWNDDGAARWRDGHLPAPVDRPLPARLWRTWQQIFGSPLFGPVMGLAIVAEIARRIVTRRRVAKEDQLSAINKTCVTACYLMLFIGLATWISLTHLVDRFAIVLLIPACVLFARAYAGLRPVVRSWVFPLVIVATAGLNLRTTLGTFAEAKAFEVLAARATDGLDWFTDGEWVRADHIPRLNTLAASGGMVLMIGDARRFYLNKGVDYCVVFNRNPFAEAAEQLSPVQLVDWLRQRGYTNVYVDWGEMSRLRRSRYGFWKAVDADLFGKLQEHGLRAVQNFAVDQNRPPYATLYEITALAPR